MNFMMKERIFKKRYTKTKLRTKNINLDQEKSPKKN